MLHGAFAVVAILGLLLPAPAQGARDLILVIAQHGAVAGRTGDRSLWRAWTVLAPLSLMMVLPDWFLSDVLGILAFPCRGGPLIGTVPLAMAGMRTIALMRCRGGPPDC